MTARGGGGGGRGGATTVHVPLPRGVRVRRPAPEPAVERHLLLQVQRSWATGKPPLRSRQPNPRPPPSAPADSTAPAAVFIARRASATPSSSSGRWRRGAAPPPRRRSICVEAFCGTAPLLGVLSEAAHCARLGLDLDAAQRALAAAARAGFHDGAARMDVARALRPASPPHRGAAARRADDGGRADAANAAAAARGGGGAARRAGWAWAGGPHGARRARASRARAARSALGARRRATSSILTRRGCWRRWRRRGSRRASSRRKRRWARALVHRARRATAPRAADG